MKESRSAPLFDVRKPSPSFADLIVSGKTHKQLARVVDEHRRADVLGQGGLKPKSRLLFCGPSGCGKSLAAHVLASELKVDLLCFRLDALLSQAAKLRNAFEEAWSRSGVLFLDGFDAIGGSREAAAAFIQVLDHAPVGRPLIAATNDVKSVAPALWWRFDDAVAFDLPSPQTIEALLSLKLRDVARKGIDLGRLAHKLRGLTHAEVAWICAEARKTVLLRGKGELTRDIVDEAILGNREKRKLREPK